MIWLAPTRGARSPAKNNQHESEKHISGSNAEEQLAEARDRARSGAHEIALHILDALCQESLQDVSHQRTIHAEALRLKIRELLRLGRVAESLDALEVMLQHFDTDRDPAIRESVSGALLLGWAARTKQLRHSEAEAIADRILSKLGDRARDTSDNENVTASALLAKARSSRAQGHVERALNTVDQLIRNHGDSNENTVLRNVANALVAKSEILDELGRSEEAIETREAFLTSSEDVIPRSEFASIALRHALALDRAGEADRALLTLARVTSHVADVGSQTQPRLLADALYLESVILYRQGRCADALTAIERLLEGCTSYAADAALAEALWMKSRCMAEAVGDREGELAALDELLERFGASRDPHVELTVARAMYNKGLLLRDMGSRAQAASLLEEVFRRYVAEPPMREPYLPFRALYAALVCFAGIGDIVGAIRCTDDLIAALASAPTDLARVEVGSRLTRAGEILCHRNAHADALRAFGAVEKKLSTASDPDSRAWAVRAQLGAGMALSRAGRAAEAREVNNRIFTVGEPALIALDGMYREVEEAGGAGSRERLAWLLLMKAGVLEALGRDEDRVAALREIVARFGADSSSFVRQVVAAARSQG